METPTKFRGFDVAERPHVTRSFVCRACANQCDVQKVSVAEGHPLFFGARCERFERGGPEGGPIQWRTHRLNS